MGIHGDAREAMTFRPMPLLTVLSVVSLVILMMLGSWQYQRYSEKMARPAIAQIDDEVARLEIAIDRAVAGNIQQVYGFADSEPIWRRYAPGYVVGTDTPVLVMIEATGGAVPVAEAISDLPSSISYDGILARKVQNNSAFNAKDNPDEDQWYTLAPDQMWRNLGLPGEPLVAEPIIMTVKNASDLSQSRLTANPYAFAKAIDPLPPERHFGYALTWWGMALGLIGVYVALHRSRGRLKF